MTTHSRPSTTKSTESNNLENSYCRVLARGLRRANEESFTALCFEHEAQGVSEDLVFRQPELVYDAKVVETDACDINAFFLTHPGEEFLALLKTSFPEAEITLSIEQNQDWMENWKKGFEPFCFADPFWIVPSWREVPAEAKQYLFVDPGMAFGTGTHETTRLAAKLMLMTWPSVASAAGAAGEDVKVLDVGTGTGVLALVAEKLGASEVTAIDVDPEARRVARENIRLNDSVLVEVPELNLEEIEGTYDLVLANIIDGVLLGLKDDLFRVLKPGGTLILSGILTEREGAFLDEFLAGSSRRNRRRMVMGDWSAFVIR
jgi:ribosomal protein L11 methyltransferase